MIITISTDLHRKKSPALVCTANELIPKLTDWRRGSDIPPFIWNYSHQWCMRNTLIYWLKSTMAVWVVVKLGWVNLVVRRWKRRSLLVVSESLVSNRMISSMTLPCINAIVVKQIGMLVQYLRVLLWVTQIPSTTSNEANHQLQVLIHRDIIATSLTDLVTYPTRISN